MALFAIAALLGITVAVAVTLGLVRPVRRLLAGTAAVEGGALDTVVPITSRPGATAWPNSARNRFHCGGIEPGHYQGHTGVACRAYGADDPSGLVADIAQPRGVSPRCHQT